MTIAIIVITALISYISFNNQELSDRLRFNAYYIKHSRQIWRFFSHGLVHSDLTHLLVNMLVLWSFGRIVEQVLSQTYGINGYAIYFLFYLSALFMASVFSFIRNKDNIWYNAVGASGAVSAVVFLSIIFYPLGKIYLFFVPIPIPAPIFGVLYLIYSAVMSKRGKDGVAHDVHFWGAVFGLLFPLILNPDWYIYFYKSVF